MKKKAIALMILISTFTFSKELRFKIFLEEPGESYIVTDKEYTEIPVKYDNDKISHWKFKIIDKGLHDSDYIVEAIENNKYNHTFSLNKEDSFYWIKGSFIFPSNKVHMNYLNLNNHYQLCPALVDTNVDLLKSSISDFDNRKINKVKLNDKYNLWSRYSLEYNEHKFANYNLKYTFIKNVGLEYIHYKKFTELFAKKSIMQTLNVGIDRVYKNSSTGIFLTLGLENSKVYKTFKLAEGNKFKIIKNNNFFYTADTVATMFGVGLSHSNSFSNGIYYDILAQASTFNRKMTSHDNQSANSRSYAISVSGELGAKINVTPDFSITPQVQQIYHYYHQNKFTNSVDITMPAQNEHIFNTRLGVKVGYKDIYGKVNTYLDYNKDLNSVSVEGEVGLNKKINDKFNLHTSVAYQQEVYNRELKRLKRYTPQKKVKLNLGISY